MKSELQRYAWIGYLVGVLGLLALGSFRLVLGSFDTYGQFSLAVALAGLAAGLIMDPGRVQRWLIGRQARYGSNALVMTFAFLGILVALNWLARDSDVSRRWDLTEDREFTLAAETLGILNGLPEPVTVTGFFTPRLSGQQDRAEGLLEQYRYHSEGKVAYRFVDPVREPAQAQAAQITQDGELVLESGGRVEHVTLVNEQEVSTALLKLSDPTARTVYFLTGEGQRSVADVGEEGLSQAKSGLERLNFTVATFSLLISDTVPADASVVIVAAPTRPPGDDEVAALDEYLNSGGGLIYLAEPLLGDPAQEALPDALAEYLDANWGISLQDDLVLEPQSLLGPATPVVEPASGHGSYGSSSITDKLGGLATIFFSARSLETRTVEEDHFLYPAKLVETTAAPNAWGETDLASLSVGEAAFDEDADNAGPVTLAASVQDSVSGARVVVFGDADFASNLYLTAFGNGDLFYNAVNWASGQENLLSLPPRSRTPRFVRASPTVQGIVLLVTVFGMPSGVLILGGVVWYQRRRRG